MWENLRAVETLLLTVTHKTSHAPSPSTEAIIWKDPGSDLFADLGKPLKEAGGNGDFPEDTDAGGSHLGSSFYHEDNCAGKHHFGALSLAYQNWQLTSPPAGWHQCQHPVPCISSRTPIPCSWLPLPVDKHQPQDPPDCSASHTGTHPCPPVGLAPTMQDRIWQPTSLVSTFTCQHTHSTKSHHKRRVL